jgi:hypothetical protein
LPGPHTVYRRESNLLKTFPSWAVFGRIFGPTSEFLGQAQAELFAMFEAGQIKPSFRKPTH